MLNLYKKLAGRDESIRVGIIGAGLFGTKLADQIERAPGMTVAAIADIETSKARSTFAEAGVEAPATVVKRASDADALIDDGKRVVLDDGCALAETNVEVVVEATGVPAAAVRHAFKSITEGKHVINVTVEADVTVGPVLAELANDHGVTYSLAYGDQPALMIELYDWARTIGMDVVAVGRGSMYTDASRKGTPEDVFDRFGYEDRFVEEHGLNARMYNSFLDGTKISVECCALANAVGLEPDVPGMHLPTLEPESIAEKLRPESDGGLLRESGVVETTSSLYPDGSTTDYDMSWSVFVVTTTPNRAVQAYLNQNADHGFHVASDGRYALFYRPYHLPGIETPVSVASAALRNEPTGTPRGRYAEVVGAAKRALKPGEELDGGGGYTVYGTIESAERAEIREHVPFELLTEATVTSSVAPDEILSYDDVEVEDSFIQRLRKSPDAASEMKIFI